MRAELEQRLEAGTELGLLVWRVINPVLVASTAPSGGGLGVRDWIINAQVAHDYARLDVDRHALELASGCALRGSGSCMFTAVDVRTWRRVVVDEVDAQVTVGVTHPTWAASDQASDEVTNAGTVNIVAFLPVRLSDAGLLNAMTTATEAKSQALWDLGINGTGTPSDALCVACPVQGDVEQFGGPRSRWGAPLARAVHRAVLEGARSVA